jgi:hypothetical protein
MLVVIAACGGEEGAGTTTSSALPTTSTTEAVTTTERATTTTVATTSSTGQEIDVRFEGGNVDGPERLSFTVGDTVSIWLISDTDEEVHVHGYDITFPVAAGVPLEIAFTADVPGIFEVELEESTTPLFELEVAP